MVVGLPPVGRGVGQVVPRLLHAADVGVASARGLRRKNPRDHPYLSGPFAPTEAEVCEQQLDVVGSMPQHLQGAYLRVGPNPYLEPVGGYHWFDGDGMAHAVRIRGGNKASYANRYIQTYRLQRERAAGFPYFQKLGDVTGPHFLLHSLVQSVRHWSGILNAADGDSTANTSLVYQAQQLLCLQEGDTPYALRLLDSGVVETLGRKTFEGELFGFGYNVDKAPFVKYTVVDAAGNVTRDFPVRTPRPTLMHDCAITQDFVIFVDTSLVFVPERLVIHNAASPFYLDKSTPSRFGIMPRYATDDSNAAWFELPPMVVLHTAAAWQEGPKNIKLAACCFDELDLDPLAHFKTPAHMPHVELMTFDLASGAASRRRMSPVVGDFPQIPAHLVGRKARYVYLATIPEDATTCDVTGIAKMDLNAAAAKGNDAGGEKDALAGALSFPPGFVGGDPIFVVAEAADGTPQAEDAGHLVTFLTHATSGESLLAVYDAATMALAPVATVAIPHRVPAGFHALHISEVQLAAQKTSDLKL